MFLTRMQINTARRAAQKLLSSPQAMHAAVLAGFPDPRPSRDGRVLWRVDTYQPHRVLLYTVSPDKPDFTHLRVGQRWHFRLTANPVHSARRAEWTQTKPLAHVTVAQQERWLLDRAEKFGFRISTTQHGDLGGDPDVAVVNRAVRHFTRGAAQVTISMATFEGHLEITDAHALRAALTFGIGRAKSYGCGLLTLAPLTARQQP
jgi:CRISPR system Cascade subunit CasE